jgi:hypothetical protein
MSKLMKRVLLSICLLLSLASSVQAHLQPPITEYVQFSETLCIVKVVSIDKNVVTFSVEEIVKGKPPTVLKLVLGDGSGGIALNSEWLLASTAAKEDTVGWALDGDEGWVNAPIRRVDGTAYLVGNYSFVEPKIGTDISKGMSLEELKELAKKPTDHPRLIILPVAH